ncbi:MAG: 1-acyl-sn-glycerol-3-phosphate acyltransferase [Lachnospiraceae bacterium]|nr:1-acyl-sn-glycerol-3-phosphate acyltransferase [Lachnospiraceae bacterium]
MSSKDDTEKRIKRQERTFRILRPLLSPFMRGIVNYSFEAIPEVEGPYLLLCNHNTDLDPLLLSMSSKRALSFVATEKITRMGLIGKLAVTLADPILHRKGKNGKKTILSILARLKEGRSVAMFPEGNRSFNGLSCEMSKTNARLIQSSGCTLITYKLEGGYFTSPRWGKGIRKGRMRGKLSGVYSPEVFKEMTLDKINELLRKDLFVDAYADQKADPVKYRGKRMAEGIESAVFMCPECGKIGTLKSLGNEVTCDCGFKAAYDDYGYLVKTDGTRHTVTELDTYQREKLSELVSLDMADPLFTDSVTVNVINIQHKVTSQKEAELSAFPDRLVIDGEEYPFEKIEGVAVHRKNLLIVNIKEKEDHFEFTGSKSFSALKYVYLFKIYQASLIQP